MSDPTPLNNPAFTSEVVYQLPCAGEIQPDVSYGENEGLLMDIYYPEERKKLMPAVILLTGISDPGFQARIGIKSKQVMWYISWAKLLAASGFVAITYSNIEPYDDAINLIEYLTEKGSELGVDANKLGIISQSANVANALAVLMAKVPVQCAALCYGYTMDLGDSKLVTEGLNLYGISEPEWAPGDFPDSTPMLIARAGREEHPGLNESIDLFVQEALRRNAPLSLTNYPGGVHSFDVLDDSRESIAIIKRILDFFRCYL